MFDNRKLVIATKSTLACIYESKKCIYLLEKKYPNNKTFEDPTFCDFCNP